MIGIFDFVISRSGLLQFNTLRDLNYELMTIFSCCTVDKRNMNEPPFLWKENLYFGIYLHWHYSSWSYSGQKLIYPSWMPYVRWESSTLLQNSPIHPDHTLSECWYVQVTVSWRFWLCHLVLNSDCYDIPIALMWSDTSCSGSSL